MNFPFLNPFGMQNPQMSMQQPIAPQMVNSGQMQPPPVQGPPPQAQAPGLSGMFGGAFDPGSMNPALMGLGAAMVSGNPGAFASTAMPLYAQQAQKRQAEGEKNRTLQWLEQNRPDLAAMVRAGMPVSQAWQIATQKPAERQIKEDAWGVPRYVDDGKPVFAQQGAQASQPGSGEQMPSSPAQAKFMQEKQEAEQKRKQSDRSAVETADRVIGMVDKAISQIDKGDQSTDAKMAGRLGLDYNPNTGLSGYVLGRIPGTQAHDLRATLDTIKTNAGFDKLQAMRDASPTGGALGQVSNIELRLLQSAIANLEQSQSEAQLRENLQKVRDVYAGIIHGKYADNPEEFQDTVDQMNSDGVIDYREYFK